MNKWTKYKGLLLFSHVRLFATPWTAAYQAPLSSTISWNLLRFVSIESVMPSSHLILCCLLLLLPSILPSIRVLSSESALCIRWPQYWSFSFTISSSNEYSGLISFRIDWFDLLAVEGTLKSPLQYHSSKASMDPKASMGPDFSFYICYFGCKFVYISWFCKSGSSVSYLLFLSILLSTSLLFVALIINILFGFEY